MSCRIARATGGRYRILGAESLMVFVPHDPAGTLGPRREQRQQYDGNVGVAPDAVREPAPIGGKRDRAAAPIAQPQDRRPIVQRHHDRVDCERYQCVADPEAGVVSVDAFSQPLESPSPARRRIGLRDVGRQNAPRGGQPSIRLPRPDPDGVLGPQSSRPRAPPRARCDAGAIARRQHGASRPHVAHDLLHLVVLERNEGIEQDEHGGAMGALGGERRK